mgnify:CR=1 FL=1
MSDFIMNFKIVDNYKYFKSFPDAWINEESLDKIGPRYCDNCRCYGTINNIFIGYCLNCANIFNGTRGYGMSGNEIINNPTDFDFNKCPYMSSLEQIELIKIIEKFKIVPIPPPPVLSRSFASDIIDQNEIWCKNYGWDKYKEYECLDRADSIS